MKNIGRHFGLHIFEPLYEHLCKGHLCVSLFIRFINAYATDDANTMSQLCKDIDTAESIADAIKTEIRHNVTSSIFATVRRAYILDIIRHQDNICDRVEDAANLLCMRKTTLPEPCVSPLKALTEETHKTVSALHTCIHDIIAGGRDEKPIKSFASLHEALETVQTYERSTDDALQLFGHTLFENENATDTVSLLLLFDVGRKISHIADAAESAAHAYRTLLTNN